MPLILGAQSATATVDVGGCQFNETTTQFTRTQTAGTSTTKFTISFWFKTVALGTVAGLWGCGTGTGDGVGLALRTDYTLSFESWNGSANPKQVPDRLFRDPAAWMHIVISMDTTDATGGDRSKMYINGVEIVDFSTDTNPVQDSVIPGWSGSGDTMYIGNRVLDGDAKMKGSLAHFHVIDGTIYDASAFGEFDSTSGIWTMNTEPSVTYGINGGFYKFESGALTTDSSGEGNTLTQAGSPTTTKDNPLNNFATVNSLSYHVISSLGSLTNGNTTPHTVASGHIGCYVPTIGVESGKWYLEAKLQAVGAGASVGVVNMNIDAVDKSTTWYAGEHTAGIGYANTGEKLVAGTATGSWGSTFTTGDIVQIALDMDNGNVYFAKENTWQDSGDPTSGATGTGALSLTADIMYAMVVSADNNGAWNINYGNGYFATTAVTSAEADGDGYGEFEYEPPAGYYALCTKNIASYGG